MGDDQTLITDFSAALTSDGDGVDDALVTYTDKADSKEVVLPLLAVVAGAALAMSVMGSGGDGGPKPPSAPANIIIRDEDRDNRPIASGTAQASTTATVNLVCDSITTALVDSNGD